MQIKEKQYITEMKAVGIKEIILIGIAFCGKEVALISENYDSPLEMAQALLDGEIDAAICNKAYMEILDEVIMDFSSKSRIIFEKEFEMAMADTSGESGETGESGERGDTAEEKAKEKTSLTEEHDDEPERCQYPDDGKSADTSNPSDDDAPRLLCLHSGDLRR